MILWCLLTGRVNAWVDASGRLPVAGTLVMRILKGERPDCDAATLRSDAPPAVVALMKRAWAQKPAARPSAAAVAGGIAAALASIADTTASAAAKSAIVPQVAEGLAAPASVAIPVDVCPSLHKPRNA